MAEPLYRYILGRASLRVPDVQHGVFGASMKVSLVNEGPFTILLDSSILK
jgi:D-tyrosyl-tRNA(Tyr) deacylase